MRRRPSPHALMLRGPAASQCARTLPRSRSTTATRDSVSAVTSEARLRLAQGERPRRLRPGTRALHLARITALRATSPILTALRCRGAIGMPRKPSAVRADDDRAQRRERQDRRGEPAEPIESTEQNEPAEPIDRTEPTEPIERIEPHSIERIDRGPHRGSEPHLDSSPSADSRRGVSYIGGPSSQASRPGSPPAAATASRPR